MVMNTLFKEALAQARAYLLLHDPAFAPLLGYVTYQHNPNIVWGCTDGKVIQLGHKWIEAPLPTQAALIVHEILHVAFRHLQIARQCVNPAHFEIWNILNDAIINSIIQEEPHLTLPKEGVTAHDVLSALEIEGPLEKWSSLSLYHEWLKQTGDQRWSSELTQLLQRWAEQGMQDLNMNGIPSDPSESKDPDLEQEQNMSEEMQARLWGNRINNYTKNSSGCLKRLAQWVEPPKYPWKKVVFSKASSACARTFKRTYQSISLHQKINPRSRIAMPSYRPKEKKSGVYIAIDVSGSIDQSILSSMLGISHNIQDTLDAEVYLLFFDSCIQNIYCVKDSVRGDFEKGKLDITGGGGTNFQPIFEYLEDKPPVKPSILFVLTDGYGSFPSKAPKYPVTWVLTSPDVKVPFGDSIPASI